jgi:hypothetical protein
MAGFREPGWSERQSAAARAKKAALERFCANQRAGEPAVAQQPVMPQPTEQAAAKKTRAPARKVSAAVKKAEKKKS